MNNAGIKKGNIALFVPHNGCPHQCSFCDQRSITGRNRQPSADDVHAAVRTALSNGRKYDFEIAFFGGSFTAIDREYMISLLKAAHGYVSNGAVSGIRISTRPDCIDEDVLSVLKKYGVTSIELGAQSMCDEVLKANLRGHTSLDAEKASEMIKAGGFSLGLQMMTGLYKSSRERDIYTAERIIALAPDTVRIYPTVTLKNTLLGQLYKNGEYTPPTLEESVDLCALLLEMFEQNNIEVIRLGLHYSEELIGSMECGNYHPAFRELCESRIMLGRFYKEIKDTELENGGSAEVYVHPSCVSKFTGQKRANIEILKKRGINVRVRTDSGIAPLQLKITAVNGK